MLETGARRITPEGQSLAAHPRDDAGVSPVIGMILVLGISVVGIAAVVYWGLPAIDEMKANVEFRGVESQFHELDATMKELVAGTTQRTAKRWQPSISRGEISVTEGKEPWLFATETYHPTENRSFMYANLTDGNNEFVIKHLGTSTLTTVKVEAYIVSGSSETLLNVTGGTATAPAQMTGVDLAAWLPGEEKQFKVYTKDIPLASATRNLVNEVFHFRILSGSDIIAEAWYMETGLAKYSLDAGLGNKAVVQNNGAVMTGVNGAWAIENSPSVPPPVTTGGVYRAFARAIVLDGSAGFAGSDRYDVLLSLYSTSSLASYDCALASRDDCVESSKIVIFGEYRAPWHAYLKNTNRGYNFTEEATTFTGYGAPTVTYLEDRQDFMAYTLIQSMIKVGSG